MNIAQLMRRAAQTRPDGVALATGDVAHATYGELAGRVQALAGWLRGPGGLMPGDRVALAMTNSAEFIEAQYAIWHAGLTAVPINSKLHASEFAWIIDNAGAKLVFTTEDLAETLAESQRASAGRPRVIVAASGEYQTMLRHAAIGLVDRAPEDNAWLFYTSGTTGRPKGAMLSHRVLMTMALTYMADVDPIGPDDCVLHVAPMSHGSGCYNIPHVMAAAKQVIPASGRFDAGETYELIRAHKGIAFFAAPTIVKRLVDHPGAARADTGNLKTIVYGGGPMYVADSKQALSLFGNKLVQIFAQGEAPMTITVLSRAMHGDHGHPRYEERLASVGVAQGSMQVRIGGEDDETLPPGEIGEVLARGDAVMTGYWDNPTASAETLRGGWLHTGDMGAMDADGFLTLKDRSKDMIISGGTNIYPREIEEALLHHPGVSEVSVVGERDPEWGENVVAFVVPAAGESVTADQLDRYCIQHIARFKRPKSYRFVSDLPKNNYGKILKTELRSRLAADAGKTGG